jgi:UDP-N-acetyl-D-glucosamine dehydrogenase
LEGQGASLSWYDPYVQELPGDPTAIRLESFSADSLSPFDCAVITTAHPGVDHALLLEHCASVVDTRNALSGRSAPKLYRL